MAQARLSFLAACLAVALATAGCAPATVPLVASDPRAPAVSAATATAYTELAALPPDRLMAPLDLGAHLLLYTPHDVVAAPYHRNQQGVRDAFRFFNDPIAEARAILETRGIGLVVLCPSMAELRGLPGRAEDSFVNLYAEDRLPDWLQEVSPHDATLRVFAVLPE